MQSTVRAEGVAGNRPVALPLRAVGRTLVAALTDVRGLVLLVLAAAAYWAAARASLLFILEPQNIAGIWPPAGISLGALLVTRRERWPHVLAGVAVAVASANLAAGVPAGIVAGFVLANTLEPLVAAAVLRRRGFVALGTLRCVGTFLVVAVLGAPALAAIVGAASASIGSGSPFVVTWLTWLIGDAGGIMAIAPLFVVANAGTLTLRASWARIGEAVALGTAVIGLTAIAFLPLNQPFQLQAYPVFLLLVVAAVRFGVPGAAFFTFSVASIAVAGTMAGGGPIAHLNAGPAIQLGQTQSLVAVAFLASFVTAAAMAERRTASAALAGQMAIEADRAARSERVTAFAREISRSLEREALFRHVVRAASDVIPADIIQLTMASHEDGAHTIVAALGAPAAIGRTIGPGDGVTGAVIRDGVAKTLDRVDLGTRAMAMRDVLPEVTFGITCAPVIADGTVVATLGMARMDLANPFLPEETRALQMMSDLTALALSNSVEFGRVHDDSIRDGLTGVPNRRYFELSLEQLAAQRARQPPEAQLPVSAIMFDLDHFGAVNKERGHATGDRVLSAFGEILATRLRKADIVARYGGEEFVAILVGTDRRGAMLVAESVRATLEATQITGEDGAPIRTTVSAGVATVARREASLDRLLPPADVALSMAKRAGRNQVAAA